MLISRTVGHNDLCSPGVIDPFLSDSSRIWSINFDGVETIGSDVYLMIEVKPAPCAGDIVGQVMATPALYRIVDL